VHLAEIFRLPDANRLHRDRGFAVHRMRVLMTVRGMAQ
jgi:hypothetical protein